MPTEHAHTPGPWHAIEDSSAERGCIAFAVLTKAGFYLGEPVEGSNRPDMLARGWLPPAEAAANALLMAAAPELLSACDAALHALHALDGQGPVAAQLRRAIAKATGGQA